ncbi:MAG TPA: energy-coupling factor ABC transporter permease [Chloroflexota bacterium]|nr:energy-coupling factor ABC transporter permease [Chloroflexota bacterium]
MLHLRERPDRRWLTVAAAALLALTARPAHAMHIAEGFLPIRWAIAWLVVSLPFIALGLWSIARQVRRRPQVKLTMGLAGAFAFVLSALKIPSVTGSSSHPTGVALGAVLFGPLPMVVLGSIVLLFQAVLLAHGGLTTFGANVFAMAVVGPLVAYSTFRASRTAGLSRGWSAFAAAALADLATYVTTSAQMALAFPAAQGGVAESFLKFLSIFSITQIPLAIAEGVLTAVALSTLSQYGIDAYREGRAAPGLPAVDRALAA